MFGKSWRWLRGEQVVPAAQATSAACPACGSDAFAPWRENGRNLLARALGLIATLYGCGVCGHKGFLPELPSSLLSTIYADPYFNSDAERAAYVAQYQTPQEPYLQFAERVRDIARRFELPDNARIHEFGCGAGVTVKLLRDMGFNASGSDWSSSAVAFAHAQGNTHVRREDMTTLAVMRGGDPLDMVLNLHAIEHVPQPLAMLEGFRALLGPRSILYLNTNQGDSIVNRTAGMHFDSWYYFPQHLHYFSGRSFAAIAARAGLRPVVLGQTPRWFDQVEVNLPPEAGASAEARRAWAAERFASQEIEMAAVLEDSPLQAPPIRTPDPAPLNVDPLWQHDSHADFFTDSPAWLRSGCRPDTFSATAPMEFTPTQGYWRRDRSYIGPYWMAHYDAAPLPLLQFIAPRSGSYRVETRAALRNPLLPEVDFILLAPGASPRRSTIRSLAPAVEGHTVRLRKGEALGFTMQGHAPSEQRMIFEVGISRAGGGG